MTTQVLYSFETCPFQLLTMLWLQVVGLCPKNWFVHQFLSILYLNVSTLCILLAGISIQRSVLLIYALISIIHGLEETSLIRSLQSWAVHFTVQQLILLWTLPLICEIWSECYRLSMVDLFKLCPSTQSQVLASEDKFHVLCVLLSYLELQKVDDHE